MQIRGIHKADYDYIVSVLDRWWGGPAGVPTHPIFFYELGEHALVAEEGGEVVGFLFGFRTASEPRTGYVHMVGIHPDHRRRGVGQALYQQFMQACRDMGVHRMKAIAFPGDEGAIAFHRALGFRVEDQPDYAGPGRSRMVFTKDL